MMMTLYQFLGSSPRAWGIRYAKRTSILLSRFIPTCVGNTTPPPPIPTSWSVHPHVRGEYPTRPRAPMPDAGSSPRAWGILSAGWEALAERRFIPTCVGNTFLARSIVLNIAVHPHVRGEYLASMRSTRATGGSSPRAWGIRFTEKGRKFSPRFIPTCVGNTMCCASQTCWPSVHPHVRGEYAIRRACLAL